WLLFCPAFTRLAVQFLFSGFVNDFSAKKSALRPFSDTTPVCSCLCGMLFENPAMNTTTRTLASWTLAAVAVAFACSNPSSAADHNPVRQPGEDVNSASVRRKEGLQPN